MQVRRVRVAATAAALAISIAAVAAPGPLAKATKPKVVMVLDNFYKPDRARVHRGGKVRWDWGQDFSVHNVTLKRAPKGVVKSRFRSQTTNDPDYAFTKRFKKVGKYRFYCTIHPDVMRMTVRVHR
jgi:plastocyanin